MRESNTAEVVECIIFGPFVEDASQHLTTPDRSRKTKQSAEASTLDGSRKTKANKPKRTANPRKKRGAASAEKRRHRGKKDR
jgi:hypothetical protein